MNEYPTTKAVLRKQVIHRMPDDKRDRRNDLALAVCLAVVAIAYEVIR